MFKPSDVTVLLKDITGLIEPLPMEKREMIIQSGVHYSEMLPLEHLPSQEYLDVYYQALTLFAYVTAESVSIVAEKIYAKNKNAVLVSLARAGVPAGVLIKRYLKKVYDVDLPHYAISIIRGRGIDKVAIDYICRFHSFEDIVFVDGWTGKGAIAKTLKNEVRLLGFQKSTLAVLCDPAGVADMCGKNDDFLIPNSLLNSIVCGLMSRTILNRNFIKSDDFHGTVYFHEFQNQDITYEFIDAIEKKFPLTPPPIPPEKDFSEIRKNAKFDVLNIQEKFQVSDINFIKPSIGEATRVLLRRKPDIILISGNKEHLSFLSHIIQLAKEKDVEVREFPLNAYLACGIIKKLADA